VIADVFDLVIGGGAHADGKALPFTVGKMAVEA